ncbi:hypothetical protein COLO4_35103 [Corchorus olitorius]|uniref:Uncharacterized protein n=1 Tax=Corchorus olitorius TaxID=93759 RepID=A0A1R3GI64_9ROSI|nr:hypothetical protein COLO4_35103 [Corchorus olitorius]
MARTILEHLERNPATPKEKSDELKIATSWKGSQSSDANAAISKGHNSFSYLGRDSKSKDQIDNRNSAQGNEDRGKSVSVAFPESTIEAKNVNQSTSASDLKFDGTVSSFASKDFPKATDAAMSEGRQKNSLGNKPVLPSISVSKPQQRWMFTQDNGAGFTFPVHASSGVSSEPPTPSIMPSLSGSSPNQPKEGDTEPSYSFGSNKSTPDLVFSFPSTSNASNHVEASDIKYSFGSDRSSRLSFSSIGNNAICY